MNQKAKLEINNAFHPGEISFTECEHRIQFLVDGESVRVQCWDKGKHVMGMRLPLYACTAFAQMFTQTLNGMKLLPIIEKTKETE